MVADVAHGAPERRRQRLGIAAAEGREAREGGHGTADGVARNGDVCNKIGTYSVAVLARENRVPFYCCAPLSTFDPRLADGSEIPIE